MASSWAALAFGNNLMVLIQWRHNEKYTQAKWCSPPLSLNSLNSIYIVTWWSDYRWVPDLWDSLLQHTHTHTHTHTSVHSHIFTSRCSVAADIPLALGSWTVPGFNYSSSRLNDSCTNQLLFTSLNKLQLPTCPAYNISAQTVIQLLPWEHVCLWSCYLVTAVVYFLISQPLPSNRSTCHNIYLILVHGFFSWNFYWFCPVISSNQIK
jgi:hypothetical protein